MTTLIATLLAIVVTGLFGALGLITLIDPRDPALRTEPPHPTAALRPQSLRRPGSKHMLQPVGQTSVVPLPLSRAGCAACSRAARRNNQSATVYLSREG
jgi:hypothetical protein